MVKLWHPFSVSRVLFRDGKQQQLSVLARLRTGKGKQNGGWNLDVRDTPWKIFLYKEYNKLDIFLMALEHLIYPFWASNHSWIIYEIRLILKTLTWHKIKCLIELLRSGQVRSTFIIFIRASIVHPRSSLWSWNTRICIIATDNISLGW